MTSADSQTASDPPLDPRSPWYRYAAWITVHYRTMLIVAIAVAALSTVLAARLEIRADFADLLPPSRQSVRDLRSIKDRMRAFATLFVVVEASDPHDREQAMRAIYERVANIHEAIRAGGSSTPPLVANVTYDDEPARRFAWEHRFMLVSTDTLREVLDALEQTIRRAKLAANPLYIDLGDDDDDDDAGAGDSSDLDQRIQTLTAKLERVEARAKAPPAFVSRNGRYQLIVIRATFTASEVDQGRVLLRAVNDIIAEVSAQHGPSVTVGITGDVATGVYEHRAILQGMVLAAAVTALFVAIALLLYYRSALSVMSLLWSLTVGSIATFGITELTVGHLNLATAFLAAIVIGNGINPNLILLARYFEERRAGHGGVDALSRAMSGAARGTLGASLTASVAYASLIVTEFRGFRHFGVIGGIGMVLCWIAAFTVLPAALVWLGSRIQPSHEPALGRALARLLPRSKRWLHVMAAAGLVLTALCGYLTWHYLTTNPLEEDWRNLRSTSELSVESRYWDQLIKDEFDQGFNRNLSGRFVVALPTRAEVAPIAAQLRAVDAGKPPDDALLMYAYSFDDLVPRDQDEKLRLLAEIREQLDSDLIDELDAEDRALIERVRPPEHIARISDADVPDAAAWLFTEAGGERGRIIHSASGPRFDTWNVRDLVAFARGVRALDMPDDAVIGGQAFVFADILASMETDGPRATWVALLGSVLVILVAIGYRRHGHITLLCAASGTLGMIALVSTFGVKVNFLDFIALPITIGIGIDYAINIAAREQQTGHLGPRHVLMTTGGAVLLCSLTTTVGYGSLLLSSNAGIRSFGLAAILGEIACMAAALLLAPTLLALRRRS